jgi:hypothetical protein
MHASVTPATASPSRSGSSAILRGAMWSERQTYHSYLLRLWQAGGSPSPAWRLLIEEVHTGGARPLRPSTSSLNSSMSASSTPSRAITIEQTPRGSAELLQRLSSLESQRLRPFWL